MENNNQKPMEPITQATQPVVSPAPNKPKSALAKKLMLSVLAVVAAGIAYIGITNPGLFRAALLEATAPAGAAHLYVPNYDAGLTDNGLISIKIKEKNSEVPPAADISENLVSLAFKLKWTPANAMALNENSIVFDADTLFKSADLKSVNTSVPGEAIISFFSSNAVEVNNSAVKPLVKLSVQLSGTAGSKEVALQVTDLEVIKEETTGTPPNQTINYVASDVFTSIDAGKITFATQDKLRVLSTEAIDSTHVLVRFSDLLQGMGSSDADYTNGTAMFTKDSAAVVGTFTAWTSAMVGRSIRNDANGVWYTISAVADAAHLTLSSNYAGETTASEAYTIAGNYRFDNGLTVSDLASGYLSGYDQKTVILTTSGQTAGTAYTLEVLGTAVKGNTQAGLDPNYNKAKLFGFASGVTPVAQSTFSVVKAEATAVDKITLTFSDPVAIGSVSKEGFLVQIDGTTSVAVSDAVPSGNQVVLTLIPPVEVPPTLVALKADKTALVTVNVTDKPVRRASDNAVLGLNKATVAGFGTTTDLALVMVEAVDNKTLMATFNANLDQASVSTAKFKVDGVTAPNAFEIQAGFQKVKLTFALAINSGLHTLVVDTGAAGILPYGKADKYLNPYIGLFMVAQAPSTLSTVKLESIDVNSSTLLTLHFSGALKADSVTPVNVAIEKLLPAPAGNLTVVSATLKDAQTVELATAQQDSDVNYFVSMNGVRDAQGLPLGNNRVLNFLGFRVSPVVIRSLSPISVTNDEERVVAVLGENLDTVTTARLGTTAVQVSDMTPGGLSLTIPKAFAPGVYDLNVLSVSGQTSTLANALTVQVGIQPMRIISENSRSIPNRVAPDGTTPVTFWVLVEDPTALNQISSVTIDLEQIGGRRAQEMAKDTGVQQQYRQFYTYRTTVAATTPTATETLKLPVEVRKGTEVVRGTVEIMVTRNVLGSVPPVINQVYANPSTLVPDGESKGRISAQISDPDGVGTIKSVVADLGELGVGFVTLSPVGDVATLATQLSGSFISEEFTVPELTPEKAYTVTVTAQDETGNVVTKTLTLTVSTSQNAPKFDAQRSYIGPRRSVPRDGKTTFSIHAMVSDPDGVNDIQSVTAFFGASGLAPVAFTRDPSVTAESKAKSALYNSGEISVPAITPLGVQNVELVAVDNAGGTANLILQFEVTDRDTLGEKPFINSSKAYTLPKIALNDGTTPITLYTFVRDDDENLESVVVNLANLGQIGPETPADFGEAGAAVAAPNADERGCSSGTGIVCMTPGFKEGNLGQWFSVSGVTISKEVAASDKPYSIEVIATDMSGNVARGQILVSVRDSLTAAADKTPPSMVASVPVGSGSVEVVFSKPLDATSISASGSEFTITQSQDVNQKLNVFGATIDASGRVVTLTTDVQQPSSNYVLSVSSKVTDSAGIPMASGRGAQSSFTGFEDSDKAPVVDSIGPVDGETVEIDFQSNLRPTSVRLGDSAKGGNFDIRIEDAESNQSLAVKAVRFLDSGKSLEVKTDPQKSSTRYRVTIPNVASAAGIQSRTPITKFFKSINIKAIQKAAVSNGADLNGDGKVDFIDFTMFSAVYGQSFSQAPVESGLAGGQGLSPIVPPPDSTVTHTSSPAGN